MAKAPLNIRSLAREHTEMAVRVLARIARFGETESARAIACVHLLDRGWGKAPQTHTGEDGEGDIRITIRHLVRGELRDDAPPTIDVTPTKVDGDGNT